MASNYVHEQLFCIPVSRASLRYWISVTVSTFIRHINLCEFYNVASSTLLSMQQL